jgi:hypothetical protein
MGTGDGAADAANLAGSLAKDIYLETGLSRHGSDYSAASGGHRRGGRRRERVRLQVTILLNLISAKKFSGKFFP